MSGEDSTHPPRGSAPSRENNMGPPAKRPKLDNSQDQSSEMPRASTNAVGVDTPTGSPPRSAPVTDFEDYRSDFELSAKRRELEAAVTFANKHKKEFPNSVNDLASLKSGAVIRCRNPVPARDPRAIKDSSMEWTTTLDGQIILNKIHYYILYCHHGLGIMAFEATSFGNTTAQALMEKEVCDELGLRAFLREYLPFLELSYPFHRPNQDEMDLHRMCFEDGINWIGWKHNKFSNAPLKKAGFVRCVNPAYLDASQGLTFEGYTGEDSLRRLIEAHTKITTHTLNTMLAGSRSHLSLSLAKNNTLPPPSSKPPQFPSEKYSRRFKTPHDKEIWEHPRKPVYPENFKRSFEQGLQAPRMPDVEDDWAQNAPKKPTSDDPGTFNTHSQTPGTTERSSMNTSRGAQHIDQSMNLRGSTFVGPINYITSSHNTHINQISQPRSSTEVTNGEAPSYWQGQSSYGPVATHGAHDPSNIPQNACPCLPSAPRNRSQPATRTYEDFSKWRDGLAKRHESLDLEMFKMWREAQARGDSSRDQPVYAGQSYDSQHPHSGRLQNLSPERDGYDPLRLSDQSRDRELNTVHGPSSQGGNQPLNDNLQEREPSGISTGDPGW